MTPAAAAAVNFGGDFADNLRVSVGGVSAGGSAASFLTSPAVRMAQLRGSSLGTLMGSATGEPSDLVSFTSAAVAMPLFHQPGLLTGLTAWDGSMTPGSQRTAPKPSPGPAPAPVFSFNPFDRASWWAAPKGSSVDTTA